MFYCYSLDCNCYMENNLISLLLSSVNKSVSVKSERAKFIAYLDVTVSLTLSLQKVQFTTSQHTS